MSKERVFVFPAANAVARSNLDRSIRKPLDLDRTLSHFSNDDAEQVRAIAAEHGLYAWGAIPGQKNTPCWESMERGDWVLCVFEGCYRYVAQVVQRYDNESFANDTWGRDAEGQTWSLMYFLTRPRETEVSVEDLSDYLHSTYRGFSRISDERILKIERDYGSISSFIDEKLLGGEHVDAEPKPEEARYFLIRLNEQSQYEDQLGARYGFTNQVPNQKKLVLGGHVVVDRKTSDGIMLIGYGVLGPATKEESGSDDGVTTFRARFEEWHPISPPYPISGDLQQKIRALPKYNVQHAIRPITHELHTEMIAKALQEPICLLGTWRTVSEEFDHIRQAIAERGGWASWWSFVVPTELTSTAPFWLYANEGGGHFPFRAKVSEVATSQGNDGIVSPWADLTDPELKDVGRVGARKSEICKTWLRLTEIERLSPALTTDDFVPAVPWSTEKSLLNQNAFGFARRRAVAPPAAAAPVTSYSIEEALETLFLGREVLTKILAGLGRKMNVILQGPPGVGKTFAAREIAYALIGQADDSRVEMVQFHQSYAYEDFVQGWRPNEDGGFELKPGLFYSFCDQAQKRPGDRFVFIIDEINRGNLSKILGELMMLIEPDKRGVRFSMPLTYSKDIDHRFYVPQNVYLIGLMNTADRSLAMVDYALRRRFMFFDIEPGFEAGGFELLLQSRGASPELITRIRSRMRSLNEQISNDPHLGRGFRVGHSYFCPGDQTVADEAWYRAVISSEVVPLIHEYWSDQSAEAIQLIDELLA